MNLGPKTIYDLNIALIVLSILAVSGTWADLIGPMWSKVVKDCLLCAYAVLCFVVTGVRPPPPPAK